MSFTSEILKIVYLFAKENQMCKRFILIYPAKKQRDCQILDKENNNIRNGSFSVTLTMVKAALSL